MLFCVFLFCFLLNTTRAVQSEYQSIIIPLKRLQPPQHTATIDVALSTDIIQFKWASRNCTKCANLRTSSIKPHNCQIQCPQHCFHDVDNPKTTSISSSSREWSPDGPEFPLTCFALSCVTWNVYPNRIYSFFVFVFDETEVRSFLLSVSALSALGSERIPPHSEPTPNI